MKNELEDKKIAILMTEGFEEVEYIEPRKTLEDSGATVEVISLESGNIKAWNNTDWGKTYVVDKGLGEAHAGDYDGLLLPGGVMNPDKLRNDKRAVDFTKSFFEAGKPIAAICHAPQLLIETGALKGRKLTSYESLKTDLENAGANWVNQDVVVDSGLVTSRKPDDIPAFNNKMVEEFCEGKHEGQKTVAEGQFA